jgi:branched-chain amino acid transport system substrate-binding protein
VPWAGQALYVTGKRTLDTGNPDQAGKIFLQFLGAYPQHEMAAAAKEILDKISRLVIVNRFKFGCILPLSGPYAPYGRALKQGLDLALTQVNAARSESEKLSFVVADSEAQTQAAVAALEKLANEDHVLAVIGPALSASVRALLPQLDQLRIPVISPAASEPGLTQQSPYFFRYLLTNEQQGEAMAEYIVLRQGYKRIGVLHSQSRYDTSLAEAFIKKAELLGGEILAHSVYPQQSTDFKEAMIALGGIDPGPLKNQELEERKNLDQMMETWSQQIADKLAPGAQAITPAQAAIATPVPGIQSPPAPG